MTTTAVAVADSRAPHRSFVSPGVVEPYDGRYTLEIRTGRDQTHEYALRLQNHIIDNFRVEPAPFSDFLPLLDETSLRENLNFDRNLPRFLYLGHRYWSHPDMVLATPLHFDPNPDGGHAWALLTVHPPLWRGAPPQVIAREFVTAYYGQSVMRRLMQRGGPSGGVLEPGHVLNIDQVFQELRMLRWSSWNPGL